MDNDIVIAIICKRRKVKIRKKRSAWVKPWLKRREERGIFLGLMVSLRNSSEIKCGHLDT